MPKRTEKQPLVTECHPADPAAYSCCEKPTILQYMNTNCLYVSVSRWAALAAACFWFPLPFRPIPAAIGERSAHREKVPYRGERRYWFPGADITVSSEQLGIPGSQIDLKRDLGLTISGSSALRGIAAGAQPQVRLNTSRSTTTQATTLTPGHHLQRHPLSPRRPGELRLDWKRTEMSYE